MAFRQSPSPSDERLEKIRRFFLQPKEAYSIPEISALWRVHEDDVCAIFHDELARSNRTERITWEHALGASVSFCMLRPLDIERALGLDFTRVRPEAWRTDSVVVHLPKFVIESLASEPSVPSDLPLDVRIEQLLIELFKGHPSRTAGISD